jgi:transaldolase
MYVEELIGPDTVSTMPEDLIRAFQDHGRPRPGLRSGLPEARRLLDELAFVGVDYDELTDALEREGVRKFADSFDSLMESLRENQRALSPA